MSFESVKREIDEIAKTSKTNHELMDRVTRKLNERMLKYNWVGFYLISLEDPNMLVLGPFVGAMTPHSRIPLNQGICGAAASPTTYRLSADEPHTLKNARPAGGGPDPWAQAVPSK